VLSLLHKLTVILDVMHAAWPDTDVAMHAIITDVAMPAMLPCTRSYEVLSACLLVGSDFLFKAREPIETVKQL